MAITAVANNPIVVTGTTNTNDLVFANPVFIKFVYWYNPTTEGHLLSLKDENGRVIVPGRCESNNKSQWFPIFTHHTNIYCDDLDSGAVYIYIR